MAAGRQGRRLRRVDERSCHESKAHHRIALRRCRRGACRRCELGGHAHPRLAPHPPPGPRLPQLVGERRRIPGEPDDRPASRRLDHGEQHRRDAEQADRDGRPRGPVRRPAEHEPHERLGEGDLPEGRDLPVHDEGGRGLHARHEDGGRGQRPSPDGQGFLTAIHAGRRGVAGHPSLSPFIRETASCFIDVKRRSRHDRAGRACSTRRSPRRSPLRPDRREGAARRRIRRIRDRAPVAGPRARGVRPRRAGAGPAAAARGRRGLRHARRDRRARGRGRAGRAARGARGLRAGRRRPSFRRLRAAQRAGDLQEEESGMTLPTAITSTLSAEELRLIDAYWRAANYLSVGQIYLLANPLLREPLRPEHMKPRLLGHFGTTPGLNLVYAHLNRAICDRDLSAIYITGPGHGGPGIVANDYLEGTYSEVYPHVGRDEVGLRQLFRQFSFPGGVPSHVAPETPGSIHEGGELGYSLSHAHGAAFDNPGLIVACVIGDGEAETGPLAASWHSGRFLNPASDGAVLPILHLNGWKIANPAVLARIPEPELDALLRGYGYEPVYVTGHEPSVMHQKMAGAAAPRWPVIVLRSPKGWTGPAEVDGLPVEGTWRSHQVPLAEVRTNPAHLRQFEEWLRSYRPAELFDDAGRPRESLLRLVPRGERRLGASPHANGGQLLRDLVLPDFRDYATGVPAPGAQTSEPTKVLGEMLRDVMRLNDANRNFRIVGPDETESNRLSAVLEVTGKTWEERLLPVDQHLAADGRVMEILSEHTCQGWLEGYLLTGRHGLFSCYEAFIHIVDSMFNQHAKWLKVSRRLPWRRPVASLNYLLTSHVWRQDHNGFSHQDPGFIDHVMNKKAEVIRVYLPPDANTLLSVADHCLRSRHYVNVIVAGKQPALDYLPMEEAIVHCTRGLGIWEWASSDDGGEPDVVMACCGDIPTLETLAAVSILRERLPELKVRVVNVVDLMRLQPEREHPHGLADSEFDALFTADRPIVFAYHGYPWLIHRLTYRRANHGNLHVRGYKEEGTTTTPFDMVMLNDLDRFHLVMDVIDRLPELAGTADHLRQELVDSRLRARAYGREYGEDPPEIRDWTWPA